MAAGIVFDNKILAVIFGFFLFIWFTSKIFNNFYYVIILLIVIRPIIDLWTDYRLGGILGIQMATTVFVIFSLLYKLCSPRENFNFLSVFKNDSILILLFIYFLINIISFLVNPMVNPRDSISLLFKIISFICFYIWGLLEFNNFRNLNLLFLGLVISIIILDAIALYQIANGIYLPRAGVLSVYSAFKHPNMYANYIVFTSIACIHLIMLKKFRLPLYFILGLNCYLLLNTHSRMALVVASLLILTFLLQNKQYKILFFFFLSIIATLYYFPQVSEFWMIRFESFLKLNGFSDAMASSEFTASRNIIFAKLIDLFLEHPLIGIGPETFYPHYFPYARPHNELLRNLAEVGLLGTIPLLILWGTMFKLTITQYFKNKNDYALTVFYITLTVLLISLTSNIGTKPEIQWPLLLMIGSIRGLILKDHEIL